MKIRETTAILLFSRTAMEEATVKVFEPGMGKKGNGTIARRLIRHAAATVRKSRLPLIQIFSPDQSGNTFGERLANAMETAFAQGFSQVIAIGNDCPSISASMLRQAASKLEAGNLVLGPAADGGVYLLGMTQAAYERQRFVDLPWQKKELQAGLNKYSAGNKVFWLGRQSDIDNPEDFQFLLQSLAGTEPLLSQLKSIIASKNNCQLRYIIPILVRRFSSAIALRGPPAQSPHSTFLHTS